ncbi:MAG: hypothetical protein GWP19_03300 [Planctomycetia bacterium]|nr:hypothetical protein [Planctomycetia bacterium]
MKATTTLNDYQERRARVERKIQEILQEENMAIRVDHVITIAEMQPMQEVLKEKNEEKTITKPKGV